MGVLKEFQEDKFKLVLAILLIVLGTIFLFRTAEVETKGDVHFFYHPSCPHCHEQMPFNEILKEEFPDLVWVYHDVSKPEESALLAKYAAEKGISTVGVPATFFNDYYNIGFDSAETTGEELRTAFSEFSNNQTISKKDNFIVTLPFFGEIDARAYSIPMLAIILGLVDGFNPCAMWVLIYLISLVLSLKDRKRIWLIVGSFVAASGILYFLFMTAWLNAFLLIGYFRPVTLAIGLFAIYMGITNVRDFIKTKGAIDCKVTDSKSKKGTMEKMKQIVFSPMSIATFFGIIGLAFVVNSVEFVCSSALPAIFTQVLAISNLNWVQHYGYILLYDLFFMLDDIVIFSLAAFAVNTSFGEKYAKYCKIIGAVLLLFLGILMVFMPGLLR